MAECASCGKFIGPFHVIDGKFYCTRCVYKVQPPIFVLNKLWDRPTALYNPRTGKDEWMSLSQLKKCGFKIFEIKKCEDRRVNPRFEYIYVFRYRGTHICRKLDGYSWWPPHMKRCNMVC
jgi:hypothetical protein